PWCTGVGTRVRIRSNSTCSIKPTVVSGRVRYVSRIGCYKAHKTECLPKGRGVGKIGEIHRNMGCRSEHRKVKDVVPRRGVRHEVRLALGAEINSIPADARIRRLVNAEGTC